MIITIETQLQNAQFMCASWRRRFLEKSDQVVILKREMIHKAIACAICGFLGGGAAMYLLGVGSISMNLPISPKDNGNKLRLRDVETFMPEGPTLGVVFQDGRRRNYPMEHIWWYGPDTVNEQRTRPGMMTQEEIGVMFEDRAGKIAGGIRDEIGPKWPAVLEPKNVCDIELSKGDCIAGDSVVTAGTTEDGPFPEHCE